MPTYLLLCSDSLHPVVKLLSVVSVQKLHFISTSKNNHRWYRNDFSCLWGYADACTSDLYIIAIIAILLHLLLFSDVGNRSQNLCHKFAWSYYKFMFCLVMHTFALIYIKNEWTWNNQWKRVGSCMPLFCLEVIEQQCLGLFTWDTIHRLTWMWCR